MPDDALRNLIDPIRGARFIKSGISLQAYALAKATGEAVTSPELLEVERQLQSETYQRAMGEYLLANGMVNTHDKHMRVVVAMGGNHYLFKDDIPVQVKNRTEINF